MDEKRKLALSTSLKKRLTEQHTIVVMRISLLVCPNKAGQLTIVVLIICLLDRIAEHRCNFCKSGNRSQSFCTIIANTACNYNVTSFQYSTTASSGVEPPLNNQMKYSFNC